MTADYKNDFGEPDVSPDDACYDAVMRERQRCLRVIEVHKGSFAEAIPGEFLGGNTGEQLWGRLCNCIRIGRDFDHPADREEHLI